jgi:hypothetical protein
MAFKSAKQAAALFFPLENIDRGNASTGDQ